MSDQLPREGNFEATLRREVDRVLADPAFERSPVQSRLLSFLCDQTVARNRNISQIAVAVDGLGRPETVDQLTESYPRVQISRLRRNLALYYSRVAPGEGLAVYIRHGDYQLRLAPPESAYGEQRQRNARPAPPMNDTLVQAPTPAVVVKAPPLWRKRRWHPLPLAAAVAAGLALAAVSLWLSNRVAAGGSPTNAPSLTVQVEQPAGAPDPLLVVAAQQADDIASNSYVVRSRRLQEPGGKPDYSVRLGRSQNVDARPVLEVSLFDRAGQRLFRDSIPIGDDRAAILTRLNGALVHIVGPSGVISRRELAGIGEVPRSDYECVVKTESDRLEGNVSTALVQNCLDRFPQSEYRPYWLTRLAFMSYRGEVLAGGSVEANGEPWQNVQQAFTADPANPFTNYLAAKVGFAHGDCAGGRPFIDRTLANGNFHGTMMAATLSDAALCPGSLADPEAAETRVEALVDGIPEANPLLHVYLIFASTAVDRPDLARRLLAAPTSETAQGPLADVTDALADALASPAAFEANRARLQRIVDTFYWGPDARRTLMAKLQAVAAYRAPVVTPASGAPPAP
jgi:hypothetical protein